MVIKTKVLKSSELNNKQTQVTTKFSKDKGNLTVTDLKDILRGMTKAGNKVYKKFGVKLIKVENGAEWLTYTDEDDLYEYYRSKVKDDRKFFNFSQITVTTYHE